MKTLRTILLSAISGAFTATLVTLFVGKQMEQRLNRFQAKTSQPETQTTSPTPPRVSRTIEEMSPMYKRLTNDIYQDERLLQFSEQHAMDFSLIMDELPLHDLTELEAERVKEALVQFINLAWIDTDDKLNPTDSLPSSYESGE